MRNISINDPDRFRQSINALYNLSSWDGTFYATIIEIARVLRPGGVLIVKIADELLRWPWNHVQVIEDCKQARLFPWDIVIKFRHPSIRNTTQRQLRARRRHCFYIIAKAHP
jgi:SAM-dependent methyltransferase